MIRLSAAERYDADGNLTTAGKAEMVAAREAAESLCCDPECRLSGGFAHVGDCTPCGCGKRHAAEECSR